MAERVRIIIEGPVQGVPQHRQNVQASGSFGLGADWRMVSGTVIRVEPSGEVCRHNYRGGADGGCPICAALTEEGSE